MLEQLDMLAGADDRVFSAGPPPHQNHRGALETPSEKSLSRRAGARPALENTSRRSRNALLLARPALENTTRRYRNTLIRPPPALENTSRRYGRRSKTHCGDPNPTAQPPARFRRPPTPKSLPPNPDNLDIPDVIVLCSAFCLPPSEC
jgi:hypothetical protein